VGKDVHPCKVIESIRIAALSVMSKLFILRIFRRSFGHVVGYSLPLVDV
jgi:hypothetical protein